MICGPLSLASGQVQVPCGQCRGAVRVSKVRRLYIEVAGVVRWMVWCGRWCDEVVCGEVVCVWWEGRHYVFVQCVPRFIFVLQTLHLYVRIV